METVEEKEIVAENTELEDVTVEGNNGSIQDLESEIEVVESVTIGEDAPPSNESIDNSKSEEAPEWLKELRKNNREANKRNKQLQKELEELRGVNEKPVLGERPTLEAHDYDEDKFNSSLDDWIQKKTEINELKKQEELKKKEEAESTKKIFEQYKEKKESLKVKDYADAENNVIDTLSEEQQNIILLSSSNPALVVYAVGKNHNELSKLSKIKDPIRFAATVARLETTLKVNNRKKAPKPETKILSGGAVGTVDSVLERLRIEADKTGDRSKVTRYLREKRNK